MSSQWVDNEGNQWRFSAVSGTWQTLVNGVWQIKPLPSGGLQRTSVPVSPSVTIVETMGPPGPPGERGPAGPPGNDFIVSETLSSAPQNGVNAVFPLSSSADLTRAFQVFRNGLMETPGDSYLVTPTHVTFTTPPLDTDVLTVIYQKAQ